jgi:long-chain acyl-CoA synthetase
MFWLSRSDGSDDLPFLMSGTEELSYKQTFHRADELLKGYARGVVALLCERNIETVIGYLGTLRCNQVPFLFDASLDKNVIAQLLDSYHVELVFGPSSIVIDGYEVIETYGSYSLLNRVHTKIAEDIHPDLALIIPTSGTTGDPKSVRLSAKNIQSCTESIVRYLALNSSRRAISLLPLQYSYGLSVLNSIAEARGTYCISSHSPVSRDFWNEIVKYQVTDLSAVPFVFESIRRMRFSNDILNTLKYVTQAGGRLDVKLTSHFFDMFSRYGVKYFTMYGQTEASPRISYLDPEFAEEKSGSVGTALDIGEVCLSNIDQVSNEGELIYSGPNVCLGYAMDRTDLSRSDDFKGVLKTGDLARIDDDGFIYVTGRLKRSIKVHGVSVNLDFIESYIQECGFDARLVGQDDRVVVLVVEKNEDMVMRLLKNHFPFHNSVWKVVMIENILLTNSGKTDYKALELKYLGACYDC